MSVMSILTALETECLGGVVRSWCVMERERLDTDQLTIRPLTTGKFDRYDRTHVQ